MGRSQKRKQRLNLKRLAMKGQVQNSGLLALVHDSWLWLTHNYYCRV